MKLGEVIKINQRSINKNYPFKHILYADISSVGEGVINGFEEIILENAPSRAKRIVVNNDTILSTVRPQNRSFYYFKEAQDNLVASTGFAVLTPKEKYINDRFLYYVISNRSFTSYLRNHEKGAAYPAITTDVIENYEFELPPLPTQKRIADILSAYDDLIENNLKRIKLLEQAAQNIYKEWFVHLRFPGHENTPINEETGLPHGWENKALGDLINHEIGGGWGKDTEQDDFDQPAYVIRGTDFPGIEKGDIIEIPFRFHKDSNLKTRKLNSGDIIFEVSGGSTNVGVARSLLITDKLLERLGNDAMCASFCKLMRPINTQYSNLLILALKYLRENKTTEVYEKRSASNIVNYNWKAFLSDVEIPVPNSILLNKYSLIIGNNIEMQDVLKSQNQKLKAARDILLPRLMNRTIEV